MKIQEDLQPRNPKKSQQNWPCWHPGLNLPASKIVQNEFLFISHPMALFFLSSQTKTERLNKKKKLTVTSNKFVLTVCCNCQYLKCTLREKAVGIGACLLRYGKCKMQKLASCWVLSKALGGFFVQVIDSEQLAYVQEHPDKTEAKNIFTIYILHTHIPLSYWHSRQHQILGSRNIIFLQIFAIEVCNWIVF